LLATAKRRILKRGVLIAIEGIDGAGKTTQSTILARELTKRGYSAVRLHEPTDGIWGQKIKELAKNGRHKIKPKTESEFFIFDRIEDVKNNISPNLQKKKIVIMDRYYFSNVAYQGARGLSLTDIEKKNKRIAPAPDIMIILDLPPEVGLKRIRHKRNATPNHFERQKHLKAVRQIFLEQFGNRPNIRIIDGNDTRSIQMVTSEILRIIEPLLAKLEET